MTGTALLAPERATAFRAARRNTAFVKFMRTALPVAALGLCSLYVVFLQSNLRIAADVGDDGTLSFELPSASSKGVAMRNPRYEGFNKDGSQYVVTAKTATSDFQAKGPIALEAINGKITEPNRTVTTIAATRGTYDQASGQLSLRDGIEIESTSGLAAKLSTAQIDPKQGSVVSDQTVEVTLPSGVIVGRTMTLSQKAETVLFDNGVRARLNPPDQANASTGQPQQTTQGNALGLSGAAANGPVVVTSKSLFVASKSNEARFETNVRAEQGSAALTATELRAKFARAQPKSTDPGAAAGSSGGVSALSGGAGQSSLETLTALGNVVLKQP
ncbi:MAG: LPS export ABC transporter periplasmic protein LptC, partial [Pseudomonadota bacterium]